MNTDVDPLARLLVSGAELDREFVATLLAPYVRVDREQAAIRPLPTWQRLSNEQKVLVYLVARKAMRAMNLPLEREGAGPREIAQETGVKEGTVAPLLRKLFDRRFVDQAPDKTYFIPAHALEVIRGRIAEKEGR